MGAGILSLQMADIREAIADIRAAICKHKMAAPMSAIFRNKMAAPMSAILFDQTLSHNVTTTALPVKVAYFVNSQNVRQLGKTSWSPGRLQNTAVIHSSEQKAIWLMVGWDWSI